MCLPIKNISEIYSPILKGTMNDKTLPQTLNNYGAIIALTKKASRCWHANKITDFDPLVGNWGCQYSALLISDRILKKGAENQAYEDRMGAILEAIKLFTGKIKPGINNPFVKFVKENKRKSTFDSFINENKFNIAIPEYLIPLTWAYLLTHKVSTGKSVALENEKGLIYNEPETNILLNEFVSEDTDEQHFFSLANKKFANNIKAYAQKKFSKYSVAYIQQTARELNFCSSFPHFEVMLTHIHTDTQKRKMVPSLAGIAAVFHAALKKRIPIALEARLIKPNGSELTPHMQLFFNVEDEKYKQCSQQELHGKAVIAITGIIRQISEPENHLKWLQEMDLLEILTAFAATEPQYDIEKKLKDSSPEACSLLKQWQQKAVELGVCKTNSTLFQTIHIYADIINAADAKGSICELGQSSAGEISSTGQYMTPFLKEEI